MEDKMRLIISKIFDAYDLKCKPHYGSLLIAKAIIALAIAVWLVGARKRD
jgi:phosphate starvation-inducible membrane PsiE